MSQCYEGIAGAVDHWSLPVVSSNSDPVLTTLPNVIECVPIPTLSLFCLEGLVAVQSVSVLRTAALLAR